MKISKRCVLFWSRGPDGYRKNDRKRAVVWPWLVLELSTVLALTQVGIRQSDWRRAGIRSTNLHIVVEYCIATYVLSYKSYWGAHIVTPLSTKRILFLWTFGPTSCKILVDLSKTCWTTVCSYQKLLEILVDINFGPESVDTCICRSLSNFGGHWLENQQYFEDCYSIL